MTKDVLLGIFRTQKNNYRLAYVLIALTSQDDVMNDFFHLYQTIDPKFKGRIAVLCGCIQHLVVPFSLRRETCQLPRNEGADGSVRRRIASEAR
jgi:hypothetical protein